MKNKLLYIILFALLISFLFLPMIQEHYKPFKSKPLNGVNYVTEFPELSFETFSNGKYQSQLEKYTSENFGFREFVIRLYNQYIWSCYHKTYSHFLIPGKGNWLFYTEAVNDYYGTEQKKWYKTPENAKDWFDKNTKLMCQLRNVLKEYDIEFLSFMAPSKPFVYPEHLPERERDTTTINAMEYYDKSLTEAGFPHIEMTKWFKTMRDTLPYPVFPNMDMHWQFTAVYGYDSLFRLMNSLNDFGIPKIKYGKPKPYFDDFQNDEATLNLMFPIKNKNTDYKLDVEIECNENCRKPKVLFVGDSFIWGLDEHLPWDQLMDDIEILFYNSSVFKGFDRTKYKKEDINLLRDILRADYVVFYTSGHQWYRASYDFVEEALLALCVSDSVMEAETIRIADSLNISKEKALQKIKNGPYIVKGIETYDNPIIRNEKGIRIAQTINLIEKDEEWIKALNVQTVLQDKTLEEILTIEAGNVLNNKPLLRSSTVVTEEMIFEAKVNERIRKWKSSPDMMKFLREKAKQKGKDLEVVIVEDARWVTKEEQKKQ